MKKPAVIAIVMVLSAPYLLVAQNCGWVMWYQTTIKMEVDAAGKDVRVDDTPHWEPVEGFDGLPACREKVAKLIDSWVNLNSGIEKTMKQNPSGVDNLKRLPRSVSATENRTLEEIVLPNGHTRTSRLDVICFPGGFDPRPNR
jgi:hypothetical protein